MPRTTEQFSDTPFARVLTRYMWSKQPPWTTTKLAAVLGIGRTRVGRWVYHNIIPELDTMIAVMARLNIPMSDLLDAYAEKGLPIPPLSPDASSPTAHTAHATQASAVIPAARQGRGGGIGHGAGQRETERETGRETERESGREMEWAQEREADRAAEWEKMLAHTREVMSLAGMPQSAIEALLKELKDTRDGKPTEAERRIAEEYQASQQSTSQSTQATPRRRNAEQSQKSALLPTEEATNGR